MDKFDEVMSILSKWETGGRRVLENGAVQICHVPHVAPQAWFHEFFAGLDNEDIKKMEQDLNKELPADLISILKNANGLILFSSSFSVYGLRRSFCRIGDEAVQPYDLFSENQNLRSYKPENWISFGGYRWDGSRMFYDLSISQTEVFRCERYKIEKVNSWKSLEDWLLSETKRLSKLFDKSGKKIDKSVPTTP